MIVMTSGRRRTASLAVNRTSAASIEKPIHNVKVPMNEAGASSNPPEGGNFCLHIWNAGGLMLPTGKRREGDWWSLSGSNR
ncbi:hypothetical protein [Sphingopyxis sp. PET50]|uniref:hypothetical protein n=1 Tax=Sphingopyxis sp. PET50 TaxID=2976533 RepID=UPI0021AFEB7E|nr:hypothetical protein [Sphingopyxis sp. PET50]